jgi:hypothetical protein
MNIYLCPILDDNGIYIRKFIFPNREQCEDKIKSIYTEKYDVDDTLDFDAFCEELCNRFDILIGDIYEIDEFM